MLQKFDPRNESIQIWVGDRLYPRAEAKVSVFDSSVQGGDAVWEGLRVYGGEVFCLDRHLARLFASAHALAFQNVPTEESVRNAIFATLKANGMKDGVHIRLTLTRGEKITSGMDPRLNQKGPCLIILAEWKPVVYDNETGIRVVTSAIMRNSPRHLDSKIHHNNLLNNIQAKIQANVAGVDAALMLDVSGFVSELNDTNIFMVKNGALLTPHADACLHGITRQLVIDIARSSGIPLEERNLSLTEFYNADQVFATGTMGELTPVVEIDGRKIRNGSGKDVLATIRNQFARLRKELCAPIPF